jgi:hypothetical protein
MSWYVDTWAPQDGIAFASERGAMPTVVGRGEEDLSSRDKWLGGFQRTVSLQPPSWEPVEVRTSIALCAERMPFQRGLFANGGEVSFASLDDVVEVVRRAYVAGGGDSDQGPTPSDNEPRAPLEPPEEPEDLLFSLEEARRPTQLPSSAKHPFRLVPPERAEAVAAAFLSSGGARLDQYVSQAASAVTSVFFNRIRDSRNNRFMPSFFAWLKLVSRAGLLDPAFYYEYPLPEPSGPYYPRWHSIDWTDYSRFPPLLSFHVPMPAWYVRRGDQERLLDQVLWLTSSSLRWSQLTVRELACVVLGACMIRGQQDGAWAWQPTPDERRAALLQTALAWLISELPSAIPGNPAATAAIDAFAEKETQP